MKKEFLDIYRNNREIIVVTLFLLIIPFFWFKPYEMDLGGDASRLYFYDPLNFLKTVLYTVIPIGFGISVSTQFIIPFVLLLLLLKSVLLSGYLVITVYNSLSLVLGFFGIFFVIQELIGFWSLPLTSRKKFSTKVPSLIGAMFYIFSPMMIWGNWPVALYDHSKIFVYPWIVYFALVFIRTDRFKYLLYILFISFLFSHNFFTEPKFFSFFLIVVPYLFIYNSFILRKSISIKAISVFVLLFLVIHAFHLVPFISSLFNPDNALGSRIVGANVHQEAINYFMSVIPAIKLSNNLLGIAPLTNSFLDPLFILFPIVIFAGLILNNKKSTMSIKMSINWKNNYIITGAFFLLTLFFLTGNLTNLGLSIYKLLFYIPGFSMFRSYFGQWMHIFVFFYSLFIGLSLYVINNYYSKLKTMRYFFFLVITSLILVAGLPLINGSGVQNTITKSSGLEVKSVFEMDPNFEEALTYIRNLDDDGKIISLPLTDYFYMIIQGKKGGAYLGTSPISYLTGKHNFAGFQNLQPLSESFQRLVINKDYEGINRLFGIMNIRYIFYNSDPYIMDNFLDFPYQNMREFLPKDQDEYQQFISDLKLEKVKSFGQYFNLYAIKSSYFHPLIYPANKIIKFDDTKNAGGYLINDFVNDDQYSIEAVFTNRSWDIGPVDEKAKLPQLKYTKISPVNYRVDVIDATSPFVFVFSEAFDKNWKLSVQELSKDKLNFENAHFVVNGYANGWYIMPEDIGTNHFTFILNFAGQDLFNRSLLVSIIGFILCIVLLFKVANRH